MRRKTTKRLNSATNRYLDDVIEHLKLASDYALADVLGLSTQAIYKMRGGGMMGAATAAKIAHILELDALKVISETELERGSDDEFWKAVARKVAALAVVAIGAGGAIAPSPAEASTHAAVQAESLCIMLNLCPR